MGLISESGRALTHQSLSASPFIRGLRFPDSGSSARAVQMEEPKMKTEAPAFLRREKGIFWSRENAKSALNPILSKSRDLESVRYISIVSLKKQKQWELIDHKGVMEWCPWKIFPTIQSIKTPITYIALCHTSHHYIKTVPIKMKSVKVFLGKGAERDERLSFSHAGDTVLIEVLLCRCAVPWHHIYRQKVLIEMRCHCFRKQVRGSGPLSSVNAKTFTCDTSIWTISLTRRTSLRC